VTESELSTIEARANAATPGPWRPCPESLYVFAADGHLVCEMRGAGAETSGQRTDGSYEKNAEFIGHARYDVLALVEEVRRLQSELEKLQHGARGLLDEVGLLHTELVE